MYDTTGMVPVNTRMVGERVVNRIKGTLSKKKDKRKSRDKCDHHWVIETPNGPTANGVCKYCGEIKEFYNYDPTASNKN